MEHLKISRIVKIVIVLLLCVAMMIMCVSPGFAVVGTASVVASAVVAAMSAFGVGTLVSGMSVSQVTDWITSELNSWASSLSDTVEHLIPVAGIAVNPLGSLYIMPATVSKIVAFVRWLCTKHNIVAGGSSVPVVSSSNWTNQPVPVIANLTQANLKATGVVLFKYSSWDCFFGCTASNGYFFSYVQNNSYFVVAVCPTNGAYGGFASDAFASPKTQRMTQAFTSGGRTIYYVSIAGYDPQYFKSSIMPNFSTLNAGLEAANSFIATGPSSISVVPEGAIDYPDYVGDDEEEMPYVVDWGGSPGMTLEQAAQGIMDKVADNELSSGGSIAIDPDNATWPDLVSPQTVPSLDEIFPFCVPFDVYHFFQALTAAPTAPRWEVPFVVPGLVNYTFVIDLTQFNTVAQIFRTMELLCFCVGLALATRKLIRG